MLSSCASAIPRVSRHRRESIFTAERELNLRRTVMRYLLAALLLSAGWATAAPPATVPCPVVPQLRLPNVQAQIDTYIASGRYDADFAAVADGARAWLDERAPKAKRPAIVLD